MRKNIIFLLSLIFLSSPTSFALSLTDFLVEPFMGYSVRGELKPQNEAAKDFDGTVYGAKIGYSLIGLLNGGFRFDTGTSEIEGGFGPGSGSASSTDSDYTAYGVFLGFDFPILLRGAISYYISSELDVQGLGALEGSGSAVQLGFGFLPLVNLFVEYHQHSYHNDTIDQNFDSKWYLLGLSLPLDFLSRVKSSFSPVYPPQWID